MWETLNIIRNGDGKLAWDGVESENLTFFLHHQKTLQKMMQVCVVGDNKCHLEVHGYVHVEIIKQPIDHQDLWASLGCSTIK